MSDFVKISVIHKIIGVFFFKYNMTIEIRIDYVMIKTGLTAIAFPIKIETLRHLFIYDPGAWTSRI